jgi:ATPase subunit of ABC transporter with duplicated ATPase domains
VIADISITEKSFGPKSLMQNVKFTITDAEKIGIIGRNGVGKSTLFGILASTDKDFTGDVIYKKGVVVVATQQEHHDVGDQTVLQYVLQGLPEYSDLSHILETYPEKMGDDMKMIDTYSEAMERFNNKGFYQIEDQIEQELDSFQLSGIAHQKFTTLSGGQKRLVEVVKIMHSDADLALIDEPTNHMDYIAKQQFIDWMKSAQESVLVITHDRDVLREVDRVIELKDGGSQAFKGNYDAYLKQNAVSTGSQMNEFEMIERRIVNLKAKVIEYQRLKEKSRTPSTIQRFKRLEGESRKELGELETRKRPTFWIDKDSAADLNYKTAEQYKKFKAKNVRINLKDGDSRSSHVLVSTRGLSLGYDKPLFTGLNIDLREGEAMEFRGRNGAGKTTLIKTILGDDSITKFDGELTVDKQVRIGVYEQEVSPTYFDLPLEEAVEKMYMDRGLTISTTKIRSLMSDYLFTEGDGKVPIKRLSGGQKARFQLIAMLANDPQLLILDEPTNHLDLPSIEEMETALAKYSGAIIYVSHDNYFRDKIDGEVIKIGAE